MSGYRIYRAFDCGVLVICLYACSLNTSVLSADMPSGRWYCSQGKVGIKHLFRTFSLSLLKARKYMKKTK